MILIFVLASVLLSCLPFVYSSTDHNTSMSICPDSFSCPNLAPFKYPFYNVTASQCGLIKVKCTSNGGRIKLGEDSYEIGSQFGSEPRVPVHNKTFERLVNDSSCKALMDNFTSPSPLLYFMTIQPFITLYKCTNNSNYDERTEAYFHQSNYHRYNKCQDYNFYYKYSISDTAVPSDLPPTCQVIRLPVKAGETGDREVLNETNIFSLLTSKFSIYFTSTSCTKCYKEGVKCHVLNRQFLCKDAKKEMRSTMSEVLDVLEDIQAPWRIDVDDSIRRELEKVKPPPPSEESDKTGLLKNFPPSPVSITGEWHSESTVSTTLSIR